MKSSDVTNGEDGLATQYNDLRDDAYGASQLLAHAQSTPNLTLHVEPGAFYVGGTKIIFAGGDSANFSVPATSNKRIDLLTINKSGALAIIAGTPTTGSPTAPAYPKDGSLVIAEVYCRAGMTAVKDANDSTNGYVYNDVRPFLIDRKASCRERVSSPV